MRYTPYYFVVRGKLFERCDYMRFTETDKQELYNIYTPADKTKSADNKSMTSMLSVIPVFFAGVVLSVMIFYKTLSVLLFLLVWAVTVVIIYKLVQIYKNKTVWKSVKLVSLKWTTRVLIGSEVPVEIQVKDEQYPNGADLIERKNVQVGEDDSMTVITYGAKAYMPTWCIEAEG